MKINSGPIFNYFQEEFIGCEVKIADDIKNMTTIYHIRHPEVKRKMILSEEALSDHSEEHIARRLRLFDVASELRKSEPFSFFMRTEDF